MTPPLSLPKLLSLEYCTVERAVKMFNLEIEDIYHLNKVGSIGLYFKCVDEDATEVETIDDSGNYGICKEYIEKLVPYYQNDIHVNLDAIYIKKAGLEFIYNSLYKHEILSEQFALTEKELETATKRIAELEDNYKVKEKEADSNKKELETATKRIAELEDNYKVKEKETDSNKKELETATKRIVELEAELNKRKPRTQPKQSDLIFALIQSIDEIKGCFEENLQSEVPGIIETYLVERGVKEKIELNERTIADWKKYSDLFFLD